MPAAAILRSGAYAASGATAAGTFYNLQSRPRTERYTIDSILGSVARSAFDNGPAGFVVGLVFPYAPLITGGAVGFSFGYDVYQKRKQNAEDDEKE